MRFKNLVALMLVLFCSAALAQQTGSIIGEVTADGAGLPGVTVEARSTILPQARITTTEANGEYELPQLPPGDYTLTFSLSGMRTETRSVRVLLNQPSVVSVALGVEGLTETITVSADLSLVDPTSAEINTAVAQETIEQIPVGTNYRDLLKLAPGVQVVADDVTRGPASGGSEQDNVYQFDGVNIGMPQYGVLNTEPSTHDIAQVSFLKGGAKAVDFNRAAGFTIDSVSKSGTSEFTGEIAYRVQDKSMTADVTPLNLSRYDQDRSWATVNIGGPILRERLFFYGSYFRPTVDQSSASNVYGPLPVFENTRDEFFGKLTFTPTSNILIHGSYRDSEETELGAGISGTESATNETKGEATFQIGIVEASWLFNNRSYATFKFNDYANENLGVPAFLLDVPVSIAPGTRIDPNNLQGLGQFLVPTPLPNPTNDVQRNFNQVVIPVIERYGYVSGGTRVGGGVVGVESDINPQDFFRTSAQVGYNFTLGSLVTHEIHVGYQWFEEAEDLDRRSNGWGDITFQGGRINHPGTTTPVYYQALFTQNVLGQFDFPIHTEYVSNNIEINDTIQWNNWSFNVGVLASQDTLYGQGLREDPSTVTGFVVSPGTQYEMYKLDWDKLIQPRLGATWAYNTVDTVYGSYARYATSVSSLPRAAAWDRNTTALLIEANFDAEGNLIGSVPRGSSSGKFFVDDLDPRYTDEFILGTSRNINSRLAGRAYARYRYSTNFWEDTNNDARVLFQPPEGIPRELYIPDLAARRAQLGGSSYVVAELEGAFTKHYEVTLESEWRATNQTSLQGTYTWSHYYGTFDQDNTSGADFIAFIGSSNLADGAGRQIWDNKYGDLHADRRHILKLYGYQSLPWNASAGAFALYQSGHAWEAWDYRPYSHLTTSTSTTNRYAEPAGSRTTEAHHQVDLNYTQNFPIGGFNLQFEVDAFNIYDNQTGYNPNPDQTNAARFGEPRLFYSPRRFHIGVRFQF